MRRKRTIQHWRMCALAATVVTAATTLPLPNNIALAAAPDTARPLGSLFGRTTQGAPQSQGSVLPSDWNRTPTQASQPSAQPAISAPTDGTARPLGTLFNAPQQRSPSLAFKVVKFDQPIVCSRARHQMPQPRARSAPFLARKRLRHPPPRRRTERRRKRRYQRLPPPTQQQARPPPPHPHQMRRKHLSTPTA